MFSLLHPCTIILVSFLGYDSRVMNKPIIPFKTSTSVLRTQRMTVISTQLVRIIHLHTTVPVTNITKETVPTVHPSTNVCTLIWMIVIKMPLVHKTVFHTRANVMDCYMEMELTAMVITFIGVIMINADEMICYFAKLHISGWPLYMYVVPADCYMLVLILTFSVQYYCF